MEEQLVSGNWQLRKYGVAELAPLCGLGVEAFNDAKTSKRYCLLRCSDFVPQSQELGEQVTAIEIVPGLKFGNGVFALLNAVRLAVRWKVNAVYAPCAWYLKGRFRVRSSNVVVINEPVSLERSEHPSILRGYYFRLEGLKPLLRGALSRREIAGMIKGDTTISEVDPLPDGELVVHVRSGDIFGCRMPHRGYGQPPLAYYVTVCRSAPWSRVHVVSQDRLNPVVNTLLELLAKDGVPTVAHSGDLADDVKVLCRARNLVCGRGTFVPAVALLSQNLRRFYQFEPTAVSAERPSNVTVYTVTDIRGDYRKAVLNENWQNTEEQRRLMLEYPVDAVDFVGECHPPFGPVHEMRQLAIGLAEREAEALHLRGSVALHIAERASDLARVAQRDAEIAAWESRFSEAKERINALNAKVDRLNATQEKLLERLGRAKRRRSILEMKVATRDRRIALLKGTFSWRITAPMRFLHRVFTRSLAGARTSPR